MSRSTASRWTWTAPPLTLVLWDLAGRDEHEDITSSYLRGAHAILYVADGTRKETCDQLPELRALAREAAGDVPGVLALNKSDLNDSWALGRGTRRPWRREWDLVRTSAKTGDGVEEAFRRLGRATLAAGGTAMTATAVTRSGGRQRADRHRPAAARSNEDHFVIMTLFEGGGGAADQPAGPAGVRRASRARRDGSSSSRTAWAAGRAASWRARRRSPPW